MLVSTTRKTLSKKTPYGAISIGIASTLFLFVLNFFIQIVDTPKMQGLPVLISPVVSLAGFTFGFIGFNKNKNIVTLLGIICNTILFIFPFAYWFIATILYGT